MRKEKRILVWNPTSGDVERVLTFDQARQETRIPADFPSIRWRANGLEYRVDTVDVSEDWLLVYRPDRPGAAARVIDFQGELIAEQYAIVSEEGFPDLGQVVGGWITVEDPGLFVVKIRVVAVRGGEEYYYEEAEIMPAWGTLARRIQNDERVLQAMRLDNYPRPEFKNPRPDTTPEAHQK